MSKRNPSGVSTPGSPVKSPVTAKAVSRSQGAVAIQNHGRTPKGSYVGRMQRALASKPAYSQTN